MPNSHRVDRVLSFFSSLPNWDSPTPSPASECVPPPFGWGGGGGYTHSLAGQGVLEVPIPTRGHRHCGTLGIYVLCAKNENERHRSSKSNTVDSDPMLSSSKKLAKNFLASLSFSFISNQNT